MAMLNPAAVPMQINVLWSDGTTGLAPPTEDFTALGATVPQSGGNFSDAMPWLGESVDIPANEAIPLAAGLHIHWTLPQALRRGTNVYVVNYAVANELVQQGVPCSLVAALSAAAGLDREYGHDDFVALLNSLAGATAPLGPGAFDLGSTATAWPGLISSDGDIVVETFVPALKWDAVFLDVYGPTVIHTAAQMKLPPVPDRWLVVRTATATGSAAAWVVESDRLTPPNQDGSAPAGTGPRGMPGQFPKSQIDAWGDVAAAQTFDFLGFKTEAAGWTEASTSRLSPLTAIGHGAVDFAAFYPNCQNVFGFHDAEADADTAYTYSVIGWFSDPADDPLSAAYAVAPWSTAQTNAEARAGALGWTLGNGDWAAVDGSIYTAAIDVTGSACPAQAEAEIPQDQVTVAIGNSSGEALSAFLARAATGNAAGLPPQSALNAAQAGVLADVLGADGPAVIENALHEQGFQPVAAGSSWQVAATPPAGAGLSGNPQSGQILLSPEMCAALSDLNAAQIAFDRALDAQRTQRQSLFADWCRSLHLETDASGASVSPVFPNGATLSNDGVALADAAGNVLTATAAAARAASVGGAGLTAMAPFAAATALYLARAAAQAALAALPGAAGLYLRRQPGPRYWRPNDPVVMLAETGGGDLTTSPAQPLPQQTVDGALCLSLSVFAPAAAPACLPSGWDDIAGVPQAAAVGGALAAIPAVAAAVSWRPLSLQWGASYFAFPGAGTIAAASPTAGPFTVTDYDAGFIAENFTPDATGIDLLPKSPMNPDSAPESRYRGRAILSSHAQRTMRERILQLTGQLGDPPASSAGLKLPGILAADPLKSLIGSAYDSAVPTLAQALSGFNDELLMLRRISQVSQFAANYKLAAWQSGAATPNPPWDEASQSFFDEIGTQGRSSPDQAAGYNPIRAGICQLTELTIVDAFGQRRRWQAAAQSLNTVIAASLPDLTGSASGSAPSFFLPPRYAQPGRLLFRWLAAGSSEEVESSQAPASTPVCGWLALNRVDETILLFLQDGTLVGWIAAENGTISWLPGRSAADITDPWFNQLIEQVATAAVAPAFYDDVNQALLTIEPRSHRHHVSRSVLESRPLAVARAELSLQLKGVPQPHQGYAALAAMPAEPAAPSPWLARETCGFENVSVPVRLGDVSMDDDGLVAYWPITSGAIAPTYTLVDIDPESGPGGDPTVPVTPAPDAAPLQLLMLLDPRSAVHATCGLLPVTGVSIPAEMFTDALGRMDYVMQVSPLITPSDSVAMPLPAEAAGPWSWLVDEGSSWSDPVTPARTDDQVHPASQPAVLRAGYLKTQ